VKPLVVGLRCSFADKDAGSVNSQGYWRDRRRSSAGEQRAPSAQTVLRQTPLEDAVRFTSRSDRLPKLALGQAQSQHVALEFRDRLRRKRDLALPPQVTAFQQEMREPVVIVHDHRVHGP
jgi:hypothetical protein